MSAQVHTLFVQQKASPGLQPDKERAIDCRGSGVACAHYEMNGRSSIKPTGVETSIPFSGVQKWSRTVCLRKPGSHAMAPVAAHCRSLTATASANAFLPASLRERKNIEPIC